jgi:uncharacterized protein YbjT (DUF2867 family)
LRQRPPCAPLAALGHEVVAVDRDPAALAAAAGPGITTTAIDLEERAQPGRSVRSVLPASW